MADQGNGGQGQESGTGTGAQGQEPGAQGQEQGASGPQGGGQGQEQTLDPATIQDPALRSYVERIQRDAQEARQEAGRYRTERNGLQEKVQQFQKAQETDAERREREAQEARDRAEAAEAKVRDLTVGNAVREALTGAKAFNPVTAAKMIDVSALETDAEGVPTKAAMDKAIADLRKSDPYLFQRTAADAGAGQGADSSPTPNMNDSIRAMAGRNRV